MFRKITQLALLGLVLAVSTANADPWKGESGKWKEWKGWDDDWREDWGETPWWGRGRGYWDGHFQYGYWGPPPYGPPPYYYDYYAPPPPRVYYGRPVYRPLYRWY